MPSFPPKRSAAVCAFAAAAGAAAVGAGIFCPLTAHSQPPSTVGAKVKPTPFAPLPVLQIGPINNKGGAETKDPDGTPLYSGFGRALVFALKSEGQTGPLPFNVETHDIDTKPEPVALAPKPGKFLPPAPVPAPPVPAPPAPAARFLLDGELSVVSPNGPYLCVLRLHDTAQPGQVVAQWAGVAQTLRDLTGNLARDSRVHPLGLAGEFARRVSGTVRGIAVPNSANDIYAAFEKRVASGDTKRLVLEAVPEGGTKPGAMKPGATFRLRVSTMDAGDVYLFALRKQKPVAAFEQTNPPVVLPFRPVLLPATNAPLSVAAGEAQTFIAVLVRRADIAAVSLGSKNETVPPAVVVLDGSAAAAPLPDATTTADALLVRLMTLLQTKKPGDVLSARLNLPAAAAK